MTYLTSVTYEVTLTCVMTCLTAGPGGGLGCGPVPLCGLCSYPGLSSRLGPGPCVHPDLGCRDGWTDSTYCCTDLQKRILLLFKPYSSKPVPPNETLTPNYPFTCSVPFTKSSVITTDPLQREHFLASKSWAAMLKSLLGTSKNLQLRCIVLGSGSQHFTQCLKLRWKHIVRYFSYFLQKIRLKPHLCWTGVCHPSYPCLSSLLPSSLLSSL